MAATEKPSMAVSGGAVRVPHQDHSTGSSSSGGGGSSSSTSTSSSISASNMGQSHSFQSRRLRRMILYSIYGVILLTLPFAMRLVSVKRLPIDSASIEQWSNKIREQGCALRFTATVNVAGSWTSEVRDTTQWIGDVEEYLAEYLFEASEWAAAANKGHDTLQGQQQQGWCVEWRASLGEHRDDEEGTDFAYTLERPGRLDEYETTSSTGTFLEALSQKQLTEYSPESVGVALARRIALDLDLPFRHRLADLQSEATGTHLSGDDLRIPTPEPRALHRGEGGATAAPVSVVQGADSDDVAALPKFQDPQEDFLKTSLSLSSDDAALMASEQAEGHAALPSHLLLQFHILNEDMSISEDSILPPLSPSHFTSQLRKELKSTREDVQQSTKIGISTHWGIGKQTRDVKWDEISWVSERIWEEDEEFEEEREVQYLLEVEEDSASAEGDSSDDEDDSGDEDTKSAPAPRMATRMEKFMSSRKIPRSEEIPKQAWHLSPDQLEIFVDENDWDLSDRGGIEAHASKHFPFLWTEDRSEANATIARDVKTLHFVLYNPAPSHRPLIYLDPDVQVVEPPRPSNDTDAEPAFDTIGQEEKYERLIAAASLQESQPENWGWIVPSWGGVVIYNGFSQSSKRNTSGDLYKDLEVDVLPLFHSQLLSLLSLPRRPQLSSSSASSSINTAARKHRLALLTTHRRTLLTRIADSISTLDAVRLSLAKLPSLEVGPGVQRSVAEALSHLDALLNYEPSFSASSSEASSVPTGLVREGTGPLHSLLLTSSIPFETTSLLSHSASSAFFDARMVGLLYFPIEHHYAVYTPLFGPLAVPLAVVGWREFGRRRRKKRKGSKGKGKGEEAGVRKGRESRK